MHVGMIGYSQTGHALSVAWRLGEEMSADEHTVTLEQVEVANPHNLSTAQATGGYDWLVFFPRTRRRTGIAHEELLGTDGVTWEENSSGDRCASVWVGSA